MKSKMNWSISMLAVFAIGFPLVVMSSACGDSNPPPKTVATAPSSTAESDSASDAGSSSSSSSTASTTADSPPATSSSDASAPAASSSKPPVVIGETKDECTPVGVDFEKRARPKLKECYATGKKKDPNLEGTVKIKMTIDLKGKIKNVKVMEKTLPDPVADCMLKVVKATPFPEVEKCWDSTITIPITFPTPK